MSISTQIPKSIVVGISGHAHDDVTLQVAVSYARACGASLEALHIQDPLVGTGGLALVDHGVDLDLDKLQRHVDAVLGDQAEDVDLICTVEEGDWLKILIARSIKADLLVLGHQHASRFARWFTDSKDEQVIGHADCPVLVVPE